MDSRDFYPIAREFLEKEFGLELDIPIFVNTKMKRTFGYFRIRKGISWKIDISKELIDTHPKEVVIDVLKHELVHYALFELKKPFRDKDKYFKDTLDRLGVSRTRTFETKGKFHNYTCKCGNLFKRKRRVNKGSYCGICKTLEYIGYYEDEVFNG